MPFAGGWNVMTAPNPGDRKAALLQKTHHLLPEGRGSLGTHKIFQFEVQAAERTGSIHTG